MNMEMTTGERLHRVAQIVRDGKKWEQRSWGASEPMEMAGAGHICGTTACVAGWGVALSPGELVGDTLRDIPSAIHGSHLARDWLFVGAKVLGLTLELANELFSPDIARELHMEFADALDGIADLPEPRTVEAAESILDELWEATRTPCPLLPTETMREREKNG